MGSPTLQTLQDPILLTPWVCGTNPNPSSIMGTRLCIAPASHAVAAAWGARAPGWCVAAPLLPRRATGWLSPRVRALSCDRHRHRGCWVQFVVRPRWSDGAPALCSSGPARKTRRDGRQAQGLSDRRGSTGGEETRCRPGGGCWAQWPRHVPQQGEGAHPLIARHHAPVRALLATRRYANAIRITSSCVGSSSIAMATKPRKTLGGGGASTDGARGWRHPGRRSARSRVGRVRPGCSATHTSQRLPREDAEVPDVWRPATWCAQIPPPDERSL